MENCVLPCMPDVVCISETHATCMISNCQRKEAGVLFGLNYSIHHHALALEMIPKFFGLVV